MDSHLGQILAADVYETYEMEQYLSWWHRIAEEHNIQVVFSIEPTNMYVESAGKVIMRGETSLGGAQDTYRHLGETLNVPVYDVLNHFVQEQENLWFYDTMHMSRLGHAVFARGLADRLEAGPLGPPPETAAAEVPQGSAEPTDGPSREAAP